MSRYLKLGFVGILSFIGLYLAFRGEDLNELVDHLSNVDLIGVTVACILLVVSCIVRAYRWQLLLVPFDVIPLKDVFSSTMIGYFGNGVFAFRLGELLKAFSVAKNTRMNTMQAFGTVIIERLLDIIAVVTIFIILIPWFPFNDDYLKYGALGFTSIAIILVAILYIILHFDLTEKLKNFKWFSSGAGAIIYEMITRLSQGLKTLNKSEGLGKIFIMTVVLWGMYYVETIILVRACNLNLDLIEIGILVVLGSIAFGIPALPGSAGTYDAGVKYSLVIAFNILSAQALNYAVVSHFVAYFPLLIIGFIYFLISNIKINEVKKIEISQ